jgi:hypothetical protein
MTKPVLLLTIATLLCSAMPRSADSHANSSAFSHRFILVDCGQPSFDMQQAVKRALERHAPAAESALLTALENERVICNTPCTREEILLVEDMSRTNPMTAANLRNFCR